MVLNDDAFYEMQRSGNHWGSLVGIIECVWFRSGIQTVSDMLCHFMNWRGGAISGVPPVSIIELFYHKEHSLIWFRNGDLNGF